MSKDVQKSEPPAARIIRDQRQFLEEHGITLRELAAEMGRRVTQEELADYFAGRLPCSTGLAMAVDRAMEDVRAANYRLTHWHGLSLPSADGRGRVAPSFLSLLAMAEHVERKEPGFRKALYSLYGLPDDARNTLKRAGYTKS